MRVAVIGAGQLGRMLALAGYPLGVSCEFYDRAADTPGGQVGPIVTGEFDDLERLEALARRADVVTFDWENVPVASLAPLARLAPVYPQPAALGVAQDRLLEKTLFRDLGIPTPPFAPVDLRSDLEAAVARIGLPGILKTRRFGYDGKGQARLRTRADLDAAWAALGGQPLIYEGFVRFSREVSLIGVRSTRGEVRFYPLTENVHEHGILATSRAPCARPLLQRAAERHVRALLERFRYVGVLAVEFFVERGRLVANEMAPRVHNSGHWTIEGAETSQFENHLRAILGLPLGATAARGHTGMVNFVGRLPERARALAVPGLHLHDYGKR
ncbi:MAG: 5-(carboxyamino)imidazole ribonucleotide synthase, partial [Proteobacteria bacterium]|nr:5-(carboxyamino)imidazole ribonucleotide synthase [Pseudomonadota bacterium]